MNLKKIHCLFISALCVSQFAEQNLRRRKILKAEYIIKRHVFSFCYSMEGRPTAFM